MVKDRIMVNRIKDWTIITFGLKGSWKWAIREMKKGHEVTKKCIAGTLRFRLREEGMEGSGRLLQRTYDGPKNFRKHGGKYVWEGSNFFLEYLTETDWCYVSENENLVSKLTKGK